MHNYAGNPDSFPINFAEPDDANISSPNAGVFNTAYEALGDRTAALANGYVVELADVAALKAVDTTLLPDGAMRRGAGKGRYKLTKTGAPASDAEDLPAVVQPTTGTGRWFAQEIEKIGYVKTFLASASYVVPRNISRFHFTGFGGGGGGGGGGDGDAAGSDCPGGAGGAGAQLVDADITLASTTTVSIIVGTGGAPGAAQTAGSDGSASGVIDAGSSVVVEAFGAQGGAAPSNFLCDSAGGSQVYIPGGTATGGDPKAVGFISNLSGAPWPMQLHAQDGGFATNSQYAPGASKGSSSPQAGAGGSSGTRGTTNSGHLGGGGGAGGGGGPLVGAAGGDGGNGGNGAASGTGTNGSNGVDAAANSGGGGGGGGGGGASTSGSSTGGAGGRGGSGMVVLKAIG